MEKQFKSDNLFRKRPAGVVNPVAVRRRFYKKKLDQFFLGSIGHFLSSSEVGLFRNFLPKLRYRCLCLWFSRLPVIFLRGKVRSVIAGWSASMKNRVGRCCKNPLWCGNVDRGLDLLSDRGVSDVILGGSTRIRARRLRANRVSFCNNTFNGFLLPYGSDLSANPSYKNYMRFTQRFGDVGARLEKVSDWLKLGLYRRVRFESFKTNVVNQFMASNLEFRLTLGGHSLSLASLVRADFRTWLAFYLRKRWWKPGVFI